MNRRYAIIEPCDHPRPIVDNLPVFPADSITESKYRRTSCKRCSASFEQEEHDLDDAGVCTDCGYSVKGFRLSLDGNGAEGGMESVFVAEGRPLPLPKCLFVPRRAKAVPVQRMTLGRGGRSFAPAK